MDNIFENTIGERRHGYSYLNSPDKAAELTPEAQEVLALINTQRLSLVKVSSSQYQVTRESGLLGYTVMVTHIIEVALQQGDEPDQQALKYQGYFIGEEFHGLLHPMLLLPQEAVTEG